MRTSPETRKLFTFASGGWVLLLASFFVLVAAAIVVWPVYQTGFHRAIGDGRNPDTYGFDLSNLTVPRNLLVGSGRAKDSIRAIPPSLVETATPPEVVIMNKNERIRFIIPPDRVIGIIINGESRAYPTRILNVHEVVNDTVGGVPVVITWSPLCDSAVVFERRLNGKEVEFGVSGLVYNSNLVFFDRQSDARDESLWSQLSFSAIAGPAAKQKLTVIPSELTTWKSWTDAHPGTRVLMGLRTLKKAYGGAQDPVMLYLADDILLFPVEPLWNKNDLARKTRILATTTDDGKTWKAAFPEALTAPPAAGELRIPTFLFAWYAQHPRNTDYSGISSTPRLPER